MAVYGWSYEGRVYHVVKGPVAGAVHHETPGCWRLTCCGERWIDIIVDREPRDRVPCPHGG